MEVVVPPPPPLDFNFDSGHSSPYTTAPSSPQRLNNLFYFSAPTSPTRASFKEFNELSFSTTGGNNPFCDSSSSSSSNMIPFNWEEKPGTPKAKSKGNNDQGARDNNLGDEFEFNFSGQLDRASLSAEELFDKGKIRPLKPPPGYEYSSSTSQSSSPRSPSSRALLNKNIKKDFDPFQAALDETRKKEAEMPILTARGREVVRTGSVRKKGSSRSLSPLRVTDILFDDHLEENNTTNLEEKIATNSNKPNSSIFSAFSLSSMRYRKWKLRDLLLFRSASEGSGSTRISATNSVTSSPRGSGSREGSMGKYVVLSKKELMADHHRDVRNSSFRSTEGSVRSTEGSVGGVSRRRLSSAELHYMENRAVAEEMRRKTPLPYKQGLLGCLGFNYHGPSVHELSRGIGSLANGR